jgi:chemotaxis protein MotA
VPMTIIGVIAALLAIVVATVMDGNSFGALIGPSSLVLVLLGTFGVTLAGFQITDLSRVPKALTTALFGKVGPPTEIVSRLVAAAETARREGVLALEPMLEEIDDSFLRSGLQQVVDGLDGEAVKDMLEIEIASIEERHGTMIGFFKTLGGFAPTMGMIGTVIGLINMLGNLSDPSQLGLGLSVALLTTLYGVVFANLIFLPVSNKMQRLHDAEMTTKELALDGVLAIQAGAGPRVLAERLEAYLPPSERGQATGSNQSASGEAAREAA